MISVAKPRLNTCWYCERPRSAAAWRNGRAVCPSCDNFMTQGVICIGVAESISHDTILDKVYRDGNWCVLSAGEFTRRVGAVPRDRYEYLDNPLWQKAGLPRFGKHGASHSDGTSAGLANDNVEDWSQPESPSGSASESEGASEEEI